MSVENIGLIRLGLASSLLVFSVVVGFEMVTWGLSDYFVPTNPLRALHWRADSAEALTALAQQDLLRRDGIDAATLARRAVSLSPLQVPAISAYAAARELTGQAREAELIMQLAGQLGWRDGLTQLWLCAHRLAERDYGGGVARCDALLRRLTGDARFTPLIFSLLMNAARDSGGLHPLVDRLATSPPWRTEFLGYICSHSRDIGASFSLLNVLKHTGSPPTVSEIGCFVQRLIAEHRFADADRIWQRLAYPGRPGGQFVHDGSFVGAPVPVPLGWTLSNGVGWSVAMAPFDANPQQNALRVEYDGFSVPQPVRQLLVLGPGNYAFSADVYAESAIGAEDFGWLVTCYSAPRALARIKVGDPVAGRWQHLDGFLHVPAADCPAQWLDLDAQAGDERTDAIVWFAHVSVVKISDRSLGR